MTNGGRTGVVPGRQAPARLAAVLSPIAVLALIAVLSLIAALALIAVTRSAAAQPAGGDHPAQSALARANAGRIDPARIARRLFDPKAGGANVGVHFVRMPDGAIYLRGEGHEGDAAAEVFRLAIRLQMAARRRWLAAVGERRIKGGPPARVQEKPKPLSGFFYDATLSPGDVVVAIEGFRVFRGSENFPWRAADFVPLDRWQERAPHRGGLSAMERESRRRANPR